MGVIRGGFMRDGKGRGIGSVRFVCFICRFFVFEGDASMRRC